jgi:hypothetical protein
MTTATVNEMARGVVESVDSDRLVLAIPQTDYQLHLVPTSPITTPVGKRIKGVIHAKALRLFATQGGGKFIEPVIGEPRIVAGMVLAVDAPNRRVLVDVAVPMWMTLDERQPKLEVSVGELVNCYVASGMTFTPA